MTRWMYRVDGGAWMPWDAACEQAGCERLSHFDGRDSYTTKSGHAIERAEQPRELAAITSAAARGAQVAVLGGEVMSPTDAATRLGCRMGRCGGQLVVRGVPLMTPQEALGWLGVRREAVRRGVDVTPKGYLAARARWEQSRSKAGF